MVSHQPPPCCDPLHTGCTRPASKGAYSSTTVRAMRLHDLRTLRKEPCQPCRVKAARAKREEHDA